MNTMKFACKFASLERPYLNLPGAHLCCQPQWDVQLEKKCQVNPGCFAQLPPAPPDREISWGAQEQPFNHVG